MASTPALQKTTVKQSFETFWTKVQQLQPIQKGQKVCNKTIDHVSNITSDLQLSNTMDNLRAGKTRDFLEKWKELTTDNWILQTISGYHMETDRTPIQNFLPRQIKFSKYEHIKIQEELNRFLECNIIEKVTDYVPGEFISNIFIRPKKNNKIRIILNLKHFNENIDPLHFKMETLQCAINSMRKDCYFGSVDLSESYYSIPVTKKHRKYFRFWFDNQKYQFTSLVMGLTTSPRVFTKVLKPVFAHLREKGYMSTAYIDDSCLQGQTYLECSDNISATIKLMDSLGLTINPDKSVLIPTRQITFIGFLLCSETMTIRPTAEKIDKITVLCKEIYGSKFTTIRNFASLIGMLVACEPGVRYAPLFYKPLGKIKEQNLNWKHGKFNAFMRITTEVKFHLKWWIDNLHHSYQFVCEKSPNYIMTCDSSMSGWGAEIRSEGSFTKGVWSVDEQSLHINVLELKACKLGIMALAKGKEKVHIRILTDNTTICSYINKFGGKKQDLNHTAREMWIWCISKEIHITAAHIPGAINEEADALSRSYKDDLEWSLDNSIFQKIRSLHPLVEIDMFASRLNAKLKKYVSFYLDHEAFAVDAFSMNWDKKVLYMFPPFSVIPRILQKIQMDQAEVVLVAPIWKTQTWWPHLLKLLCQDWCIIPSAHKVLNLHHKPEKRHPLKHLQLGFFRISGKHYGNKTYQMHQLI